MDTAATVTGDDPDSAFVLAYDAARQACTGLLAHQGLRPTTQGGHYAAERILPNLGLFSGGGRVGL